MGWQACGIHFAYAQDMEGRRFNPTSAMLRLAVLLGCLSAVGCASSRPWPPMAHPWEADQPWRQAEASSVFHTPEALLALDEAGLPPEQLAWYDLRNDHLPGVQVAGERRQVREVSRTYTHGYVGSSNGQVRDNSYTHTWIRRVEETTR